MFVYVYFCLIVIIGHYYILQLLLAVIMSNLSKIMSQEQYEEIQKKKQLVNIDVMKVKDLKAQKKALKALRGEDDTVRDAREESKEVDLYANIHINSPAKHVLSKFSPQTKNLMKIEELKSES